MNVFKTVNNANCEFSGEHWIAGSDLRVSFGDVDVNTPSLQFDLETSGLARVTDRQDAGGAFRASASWRHSKWLWELSLGECDRKIEHCDDEKLDDVLQNDQLC